MAFRHFADGGVEALKASVAPGPAPVKSEAALRVVTPLLEAPVANRRNWTIGAPDQRDRGARGRPDRQVAIIQDAAKKNFRWRRPRAP